MLAAEIAQGRTKADLLELADAAGVEVRPSWPKSRLADAIAAAGVDVGPGDLGPDGRTLWAAVHRWLDDQDADLDPHERVLVAELARSADRLASIRRALTAIDPTEAAWGRLASEERQRGLAMARLISSIGFPTGLVDDTGVGATPRSRRAQTAAQRRWSAQRSGLAQVV